MTKVEQTTDSAKFGVIKAADKNEKVEKPSAKPKPAVTVGNDNKLQTELKQAGLDAVRPVSPMLIPDYARHVTSVDEPSV